MFFWSFTFSLFVAWKKQHLSLHLGFLETQALMSIPRWHMIIILCFRQFNCNRVLLVSRCVRRVSLYCSPAGLSQRESFVYKFSVFIKFLVWKMLQMLKWFEFGYLLVERCKSIQTNIKIERFNSSGKSDASSYIEQRG